MGHKLQTVVNLAIKGGYLKNTEGKAKTAAAYYKNMSGKHQEGESYFFNREK